MVQMQKLETAKGCIAYFYNLARKLNIKYHVGPFFGNTFECVNLYSNPYRPTDQFKAMKPTLMDKFLSCLIIKKKETKQTN